MYKELVEKVGDKFYLGGEPLELMDDVKAIYLDLVIAKLQKDYYDYKLIKKEEITRVYHDINEKLFVDASKYDQILKRIYIFTEIACKTDLINNCNVTDFKDINSALNYSEELAKKNEYHLIKKNNYNGYSVHLTFEEYDYNELKDEYVKKYVKY